MTASVFYSVSPFGTGDIKVASNIVISGGVATLTAQTGNIGAGCCVEYDSLKTYIAPNRIGFGSGSVEIEPGYKYTDATSGATGIVRAVEVTGGTWGGGDAAGWIYFESTIGTFGNNNILNQTKPTVSNDVATIDGTIQGNIGNGNTQFVVKTATGGASSDQTSVAVTSIHHEYASLAAFEAGFTDSSHINNVSLVTADVIAHACCYYDHIGSPGDADTTAVTIYFGTTGANNYLQIYAPIGGAESINSQRHSGVWDEGKYRLEGSTQYGMIFVQEEFVTLEGLQIANAYNGTTAACISYDNINATNKLLVDSCILKAGGTSSGANGLYLTASITIAEIRNSVVYFDGTQQGNTEGVYADYCATLDIFNCVVYNFNDGIERDVGTVIVKNTAVFNNATDFDGLMTATYCASDDAKTGTGNIRWLNGATDWANVFTNYSATPPDFSLKNYTTAGIAIIEQGTSLASSDGIWRDIAGNERGATPDIGAFEYVAAGGSSIPVMMHHYNQTRLG